MADEVRQIAAGSIRLRSDGLLLWIAAEGSLMVEGNTREIFETFRALGGEGPHRILLDIRGVKSSSPESRSVATEPENEALHIAMAMVGGSRLTRMIGNLFMRLNRPSYPTRMFSNEALAEAWLMAQGTQ